MQKNRAKRSGIGYKHKKTCYLASFDEGIPQSVNNILSDILINFNKRESVCNIN